MVKAADKVGRCTWMVTVIRASQYRVQFTARRQTPSHLADNSPHNSHLTLEVVHQRSPSGTGVVILQQRVNVGRASSKLAYGR